MLIKSNRPFLPNITGGFPTKFINMFIQHPENLFLKGPDHVEGCLHPYSCAIYNPFSKNAIKHSS